MELRGASTRLLTGHMFAGADGSRQVLTIDDESRCALWDVAAGRCLGTAAVPHPSELLPGFAKEASDWDCDAAHFLGVQNRNEIVIYGAGGTPLASCTGHERPITAFGLLHPVVEPSRNACGDWLVAKHTTRPAKAPAAGIRGAPLAVSGSNDGTVRVWSVPAGEALAGGG